MLLCIKSVCVLGTLVVMSVLMVSLMTLLYISVVHKVCLTIIIIWCFFNCLVIAHWSQEIYNNFILLIFLFILGSYFNTARISTSYANRTYSRYSNDYANFNCPSNAGSLSSCYADNVTTVSNCSLGYGGILVVECSQSM